MSTQLILYPQTYKGEYNSVSTPVLFEYVVDGRNFIGINNSPSVDVAGGTIAQFTVLTAQPPNAVNTWYRYRTTGPTPALPTQTSNNLVLNTVTGGNNGSGVYQKLSNLVVGVAYLLTINVEITYWGNVYIKVFDGNGISLLTSLTTGAFASPLTRQFTAQSTEAIVMVSYYHNTAHNLTIESISVTENHGTPTLVYSELNDGQVICDLYQEEDIPLSLSIDDFKVAAEQVKSYSKDFNLPATKRNNQIFNNMFEITRTAHHKPEFNPYIRTQCVLKQDGFILFEGYLRLIDVKEKDGEISYSVNLYSDVIAFADVLKDKTFADLDFEELEHDYAISNIEHSWETIGAGNGLLLTTALPTTSFAYDSVTGVNNTQVLKYPFIDWAHQMSLDFQGQIMLSNLETAFRPCIQLKYLINKIFGDTQFSFTSNFFDSADFENLFMDFNWGENENGTTPDAGNYLLQGDSGASSYYIDESSYNAASKLRFNVTLAGANTYWDNTDYKYVSPVNNWNVTCKFEIYLENTAGGSRSNNVRIAKFTSGGHHLETFFFNNNSISYGTNRFKIMGGTFSTILQAGEYIQAQSTILSPGDVRMGIAGSCGYLTACSSSLEFTSTNTMNQAWVLLNAQRGELGQWDFIKGIMTMFNLVSLVDETNPNNILIEPYTDVFINNTNSGDASDMTLASRGIQHDWTDKVDVSEMELKPLADLNKKTQFQFVEDDDDYTFQLYKESTSGGLYGSRLFDASDFTILQGTEEIIAEPFASTVSKAIIDAPAYSSFVTPAVYSASDEGISQAFKNSPRIFYNNGTYNPPGATFTVPTQNGEPAKTLGFFLQFSHTSVAPATSGSSDFVFKSEQLFPGVGVPPVDNLYTVYWQNYFDELYNSDTRIMNLKVNLSPSDVASFKFYDTVFIRNRVFRVNKIDYKPNDLATVEFILIP